MKKEKLCLRVARWALLLEHFEYEICHRPGKSMMHVDALSRNPLPTVLIVRENDDGILARVRSAQERDDDLKIVLSNQECDDMNGYVVRNKLVYKDVNNELLIVVPKSMQYQVIRRVHEKGHFGVNKTEEILKKDFWFKGMRPKVEQVVESCVACILAEKKHGKPEGLLNPISKGDVPMDTYHIDHVGPMTNTQKSYKHILVVVDAFTKFVWLYPTKSTDTADVLNRLRSQSTIFGNPRRIISDRGTAFTSNDFKQYCEEEGIQHSLIVTGVPRGNGQVERIHRTVVPLLTKLSSPTPEKWYRHVDAVQRYLNATPSRSTGKTPSQLMFGVNIRLKEDLRLPELLEEEWATQFVEDREELRKEAKKQIAKTQEENRRGFNKKRKVARSYQVGDLVAIQRTQFGPGLKLKGKFLGPYRVRKVLRNDRYLVEKVGEHEGPQNTSTSADHMKYWAMEPEENNSDEEQESIDDI